MPWDESLMEQHAEVKYRSFIGEVDAYVFPCLGDRHGCRRLMCEIRRKPGFLARRDLADRVLRRVCGNGSGRDGSGADRGDSECGSSADVPGPWAGPGLVRRALAGFRQAGLRQAYLEVTAENAAAVQLYRNVGFRRAKTLYKAVDN